MEETTTTTPENNTAENTPQNTEPGKSAENTPAEKTFTQKELDDIVKQRLDRAKRDMPAKEELKAFREWKDSRKTAEQKAADDIAAANSAKEAAEREKQALEIKVGVLLDRASDIVRQHTLYRLDDIEKLPSFMQENVRKAVCAQAEFIDQNGGLDGLTSGGMTSFSIGKFSMSGGTSGNGSSRSPEVSPLMLSYLEAAGLLYRGGV